MQMLAQMHRKLVYKGHTQIEQDLLSVIFAQSVMLVDCKPLRLLFARLVSTVLLAQVLVTNNFAPLALSIIALD
jgi:hypothetical protein